MSKKEIIVSNVSEEHNNPIAELVQVACRFDSEIILESDNRRINAKSIMGIMAFNPSKGMTVNIEANGEDEQEALVAMEKFLVCEQFLSEGGTNYGKEDNSSKTKRVKTTAKEASKDTVKEAAVKSAPAKESVKETAAETKAAAVAKEVGKKSLRPRKQ